MKQYFQTLSMLPQKETCTHIYIRKFKSQLPTRICFYCCFTQIVKNSLSSTEFIGTHRFRLSLLGQAELILEETPQALFFRTALQSPRKVLLVFSPKYIADVKKVQLQIFNCIQRQAKHVLKSYGKVNIEINLSSQRNIV